MTSGGIDPANAPMTDEQAAYEDHCQPVPAQGTVLEACYNLAGDLLATATHLGIVEVWRRQQPGWRLLFTQQLPGKATRLAWSHPEHGQLLAVGTSTGQVHIIQGPGGCSSKQPQQQAHAAGKVEQQPQQSNEGWCSVTQLQCGNAAISSLAFAPHQHSLVLAAASSPQQPSSSVQAASASRGCVQLWEAAGKASSCTQWTLISKIELPEPSGTCHSLCWYDATPGLPPLLLGGHDDGGSIWGYNSPSMMWKELASFSTPADASSAAVSVHWAPALGRPYELIAASFGQTVVLYKVQQAHSSQSVAVEEQRQLAQLEVLPLQVLQHPAPVWKLEFNMMGTTLACSLDGKPAVWLWMPLMDGPWAAVSKLAGQQQHQGSTGAMDDGVMVD